MFKSSIRAYHLPVKVSMVQGGWMSVEEHFSWCFFLPGSSEKADVPWLGGGEWIQAVKVNELWEEKLKVSYHYQLLILRAHIWGETPALVVPIFKIRPPVISVMRWMESIGAGTIAALKSWCCLNQVLSLPGAGPVCSAGTVTPCLAEEAWAARSMAGAGCGHPGH